MTRRNCIIDHEQERFVIVFDDEDDGRVMRALAAWVNSPELDFHQQDADAALKTILLFSPLTQWESGT